MDLCDLTMVISRMTLRYRKRAAVSVVGFAVTLLGQGCQSKQKETTATHAKPAQTEAAAPASAVEDDLHDWTYHGRLADLADENDRLRFKTQILLQNNYGRKVKVYLKKRSGAEEYTLGFESITFGDPSARSAFVNNLKKGYSWKFLYALCGVQFTQLRLSEGDIKEDFPLNCDQLEAQANAEADAADKAKLAAEQAKQEAKRQENLRMLQAISKRNPNGIKGLRYYSQGSVLGIEPMSATALNFATSAERSIFLQRMTPEMIEMYCQMGFTDLRLSHGNEGETYSLGCDK